jgi:hypothetical protein
MSPGGLLSVGTGASDGTALDGGFEGGVLGAEVAAVVAPGDVGPEVWATVVGSEAVVGPAPADLEQAASAHTSSAAAGTRSRAGDLVGTAVPPRVGIATVVPRAQ